MRMQRVMRAITAAVALAAVGTVADAQKATFKLATLVPQGSVWHTTVQEMVQQWQLASGDRVAIRLYPGGVAGDDADVVRKMRLGTLDGGLLTSTGLADIDRSVFALAVPMAYASYEELDAVMKQFTPQLEKIYADKGFIILGWADAGWVHFFCKSSVRTPEDLKKHKIFSWAGDNPAVELWKAAGFNPVPLPSTEISTALQTGLVTALPTTPQAAVLLQWYNQAPYMAEVKWAVLLAAVVVSRAGWEKVPVEIRPAFMEAARTATAKLRTQTREGGVRDLEAMQKRGLTVVHIDAAAEALWRQAAEATYPRVRETFVPAVAFDEALRLRDAYRAGQAGK